MRFNTEAHGEALHARPSQIVQIIGMVEDEVQSLRELAARVRKHGHLAVLARDVPLRKALVVVVDVLRRRPGTHDLRGEPELRGTRSLVADFTPPTTAASLTAEMMTSSMFFSASACADDR